MVSKSKNCTVIVLLLILLICGTTCSTNLYLERAGTLPCKMADIGWETSMATIYDGADLIFILYSEKFWKPYAENASVYNYNLTTTEIKLVGQFSIPFEFQQGTTGYDGSGNFFFIGISKGTLNVNDPYPAATRVYRFHRTNPNPVEVTSIPFRLVNQVSASDGNRTIYISANDYKNNQNNRILKYDTITGVTTTLGGAPNQYYAMRMTFTGSSLFFVGGTYFRDEYGVPFKFNPNTRVTTVLPGKIPIELFQFVQAGYTFVSGEMIYMLPTNFGTNPQVGFEMTIYNTSNGNVIQRSVENYLWRDNYFRSIIYASKYNRIYTFGGYDMDYRVDRISYIQL